MKLVLIENCPLPEVSISEALTYLASKQGPELKRYVALARSQATIDDVEIDDNALVSHGEDDGAYVMAWVWVSN